MKTDALIRKIVNRYIGVEDGYIGMPTKIRFSYRNHNDFYPEYCDLYKNPADNEGTTRERFIAIFTSSTPAEQAKIIKGVIQRFPVSESFESRTEELKEELLAEADKLEKINLIKSPTLVNSSEVVYEALEDAESLIKERKSLSAVDRVHTAFQGYLRGLCKSVDIEYESKDDTVSLMKKILNEHPALSISTKEQEIKNIIRNLTSISDSLNPIRNQGSLAHANEDLLQEAEANLVINCVRTLLTYLDTKFK
jgi:hypothetical protein